MSKKILVISSTPRKGGNSDILCDEFVRGAKETGNDVEKICLRDKKIEYCNGCGACNDSHKCHIKDDAEAIVDKMVDADAIVLASPVYFYSICAQLKALIDRSVPRYTEISNKDFYYILTAADTDKANLERAVETIRGFTLGCLNGPKEKGIIYGTGAWQMGEIRNTQAMKKAYDYGKKA